MPAIRIDWQNIKNEVIGNGESIDEPFLFVLPHGGRHLLMSIIDTLKYQATYRIEDYDYADWDALLAMVELTHLGLMEGEQVNSIAESITYLADKIAENFPTSAIGEDSEMVTVTQTVNCGGCGGTTGGSSSVIDDDTLVPPDGYDIPDVDDTEPVDVVSAADKCDRIGYLLVQYRNACLTAIQGMEGSYTAFESWFDGIVGWLVGWMPMSYDVYLSMREWSNLGAFANTDDFLSAYDPNFDAMICSAYQAETATDAKTAVRGILEQFVWSDVSVYARLAYKQIFEAMPFGLAFDASIDAVIPPGYSNRECCGGIPVDTDFPIAPVGYSWVPQYGAVLHNPTRASALVAENGFNVSTTGDIANYAIVQFFFEDMVELGNVVGLLMSYSSNMDFNGYGHETDEDYFSTPFYPEAGDGHVFFDRGAPTIDWGDIQPIVSDKSGGRYTNKYYFLDSGLFQVRFWYLVLDGQG